MSVRSLQFLDSFRPQKPFAVPETALKSALSRLVEKWCGEKLLSAAVTTVKKRLFAGGFDV